MVLKGIITTLALFIASGAMASNGEVDAVHEHGAWAFFYDDQACWMASLAAPDDAADILYISFYRGETIPEIVFFRRSLIDGSNTAQVTLEGRSFPMDVLEDSAFLPDLYSTEFIKSALKGFSTVTINFGPNDEATFQGWGFGEVYQHLARTCPYFGGRS